MRPSYIAVALVLLFVAGASVHAADLANVALRTTPPYDGFAKCVAQESVKQVISKAPFYKDFLPQNLIGTGTDGVGPFLTTATLDFMAGTSVSNHMFTVRLRSTDSVSGWQLIQSAGGEIYPYSSSMDAMGVVFDIDEGLGQVDISSCK